MSQTDPSHGAWVHATVDKYERRLTLYAARMLRDVERARDVVQDTFCKLCHQDRAKIEGHLTQWLFTVCRNKALDVLRKEQRMKPMTDIQHDANTGAEPDPADLAEDRDTTERVLEVIEKLPERQQEIIRLKFQHGLSYRQISAITSESVSNVGYLLHNALKALRQYLEPADAAAPATGPGAQGMTEGRRASAG